MDWKSMNRLSISIVRDDLGVGGATPCVCGRKNLAGLVLGGAVHCKTLDLMVSTYCKGRALVICDCRHSDPDESSPGDPFAVTMTADSGR